MKTQCSILLCFLALLLALPAAAQVWEEWVAIYAGPINLDWARAIAIDAAGNVFVTGESSAGGGGSGAEDYATVKYNSEGQEQWVARYNGTYGWYDYPEDIAIDPDGNVVVTGLSWGLGTRQDFVTIKYNPDGEQIWLARYNGPADSSDGAHALAIDAEGNIYVTGPSRGLGTNMDYATIKYDPNGTEIWAARYDDPNHWLDEPFNIALDQNGNVLVTGVIDVDPSPLYRYDCVTIKYNAEGVEQWVAQFNGIMNASDSPCGLAIDSEGNVFITGQSGEYYGAHTWSDYVTMRYNSEGNLIWTADYNSPDDGYDGASGIVLDNDGFVYVTGTSANVGANDDYVTIKYDQWGEELWIARYNGIANLGDVAGAIAVDFVGNVYVTGYSWGIDTHPDYATIKYNSEGVRQWVMRYNSPDSGWDYASDIALDGNANVYVTGCGSDNNFCTIKYSQSPPNDPPQITSYFPVVLDTAILGSHIEFGASATDPDGDSLLWQWRLDSAVVATDSFCTITFNELGEHQVVCTVSDGQLADSVVWDVVVVALGLNNPDFGYPTSFALYPPHPNPFNAATVIRFQLPVASKVSLGIFDTAGRLVVGFGSAAADDLLPGVHEIPFDASGLPSGIYLCRIAAGDWSAAQKLVLLK